MASRSYLNFDLLLEQEGDGRYQARVTDSPLGETPSVHFQLPFDATTLENLLLKLDPGRSGTRRVGSTSQQQAAMDFGGPLYSSIFTGDLALAWTRSLDRVRAEQAGGLRLRLRLNDAGGIAGLPWELLYDARTNSFLAQSERTPVVRFLDVPQVPRPMTVDGPLRVLAIISSPIDLDELDVEAEWARLQEALAPRTSSGMVVLDRLPSASLSELGPWLRRAETHVIHFVGHGDFDDSLREGVIYFQDEHGRRSAVTSSTLGPYLRDHDPLRMVVLNACRSARTDSVDPFGGMAQGLVQQDATAVVAMQFPISDRAAVRFTGEFYGALVDGLPVDQAVSSARKSLLDGFRDEWATPVLFLRSPDGNIFENVHAVEGAVPTPPAPPPPPTPLEPPLPRPPGPSFLKDLPRWVRRHARLVAAAGGVLALVVAAIVLVPKLFGGDEETQGPVDLPRSAALADSELLVAAGDDDTSSRIFRVDSTGSTQPVPVSQGDGNEWLPVISPDRQTMVYSRENGDSGTFVLYTAGVDGSNHRELFDQGTPEECRKSTGRPAWIPDTEELVLRCFDRDSNLSLVRADVHGNLLDTYLVRDGGTVLSGFGDPTVSFDGSTVVVFADPKPKAGAGSLFAVGLETGRSRLVLRCDVGSGCSDAAFSPVEGRLAWREDVGAAAGGFEILTATFTSNILGPPLLLSGNVAGKDQDPMFSPDGSQVVFVHTDVEHQVQHLRVAEVSATPNPRDAIVPGLPDFQSVPAWSRR